MKKFTPLEYMYIDVANNYGLDKLSWDERIKWTKDNADILETLAVDADNPILFKKSIRALDDALNKEPSGHLVALDATTSGIQIMSALAGCRRGCEITNLIDTGSRRDAYGELAQYMSQFTVNKVPRAELKHPVMTHFYGSTAQPRTIFKDDATLSKFYKTLGDQLPGATALMQIMQNAWHPDATAYEWYLPDGHTANFKVMITKKKKIEVAELGGATFTHQAFVNEAQPTGKALAANIIHSIDGFIVREMYRRADFDLLTIHDSFWCHPNYAQKMRQNYNDIFAEYINIDLFNNIMSELSVVKTTYRAMQSNLNKLFTNANYALS